MRRRVMIGAGAALVVVIAVAGGAAALAGNGDDDGPSVGGPEADRAVAAALAAIGGGRANAVERDSEDGATWEVRRVKADVPAPTAAQRRRAGAVSP